MIEVVGLMHHAIPIGKGDADALAKAREFYGQLLGLPLDTGRPDIPGTPGYWYNVPSGPRPPAAGKEDKPRGWPSAGALAADPSYRATERATGGGRRLRKNP